eukprot:CAMPEP_0202006476 /NCGR_PEP_ID=MMETSP0905-20130828/11221_1 /ASSEMBLY_ACC=CAM_ASM_000554 /TAXON_ID=420261 /ORGANISM="Thalassiosira antarctica, Strain CCMP982" /LENGTH=621 /DNA_ID=CAMNT_0048564235 /DNA_START=184 /DNA_END=2049 /DNA_ORIENTATION=-
MCTPYPQRPGEAECRDYLRTGRCKYGESCKYNHPPNVENGGGVKPIDPSEPLFPIRPMEPPCQYFLKHGTCKFGQSCKFNHPSGSPLADGSGGSLPAGRMVFVASNATSGEASSHLMAASTSVQVLPQRPTEPNCIYFLRNGKCKYGATCKFHHPLDAINRNSQVQHNMQSTNMRQSQNMRDRSQSAGSSSDGRTQIQHGVTYATAANVTYLQAQRLQPITERVRPQQPTHILLPDGQIAVILDQQSLQNVNELNARDRPKFYLSQTDGSIGTLQSMDQNNNPVVISPMLTATTTSTSNYTFDSSIDLMGTNVTYQGQAQGAQFRGPHKSGSGGSLSAYGSMDSGSHVQGDFAQQVSGQVHSQPMSNSLGQPSFPQYAAWPMNESLDQSNQAQVRRSQSSSADALDRQRHAANSLESTAENTAAYYWPSNGSFPSIPVTDRDIQAGRNYSSMPNTSSYGSGNAVGQAIHRSYSAERRASISPSASSEQMRDRHGKSRQSRESSGDDEGLTMMTSALLTMMDRHESSSSENESNTQRSPSRSSPATGSCNIHHNDEVYYSNSEPNIRGRASPVRPPPGMMHPPGMPNVESAYAASLNQDLSGGGYFVGGYDLPTTKSPPWGE